MTGPDDTVHLGDDAGRPDHRVDQWKLVRHGGEAVVLDEGQRQRSGLVGLTAHDHPTHLLESFRQRGMKGVTMSRTLTVEGSATQFVHQTGWTMASRDHL